MNKSQLERIMGKLAAIREIIQEDATGTAEITKKMEPLQGEVAQELKNTVWAEYLDTTATKETPS